MKAVIVTILVLVFFTSTLFAQHSKDSLIVFVGEIIEVKFCPEEKEQEPPDTIFKGKDTLYVKTVSISMNSKYIAKYKILQLIHGNYKADTIEFTVFDHYGKPKFSNFKTVLLFVSFSGGELFHEKYQYYDLYLTNNGNWASPYPAGDYNHPYKDSITVKPEKIEFIHEVSFPLTKLTKEHIEIWYPAPFFEIKGGRAIAVYGNYIDDLFKLKQQTILKARGFY